MATAIAILMGAILAGGAGDIFDVQSEFGGESQWTEGYLNEAWQVLVEMMGAPDISPPRGIQVALLKDAEANGIGGCASAESMEFTSNVWPKDKHRLWIMAHELVNLFAARYGGAGGFPSDWWSNGRSPFPEYVSCLVMERLGYADAARDRKAGHSGKGDHELFWKLDERYGFSLFARFFKLVRADGLDLGSIGAPWPRPSEARSAYTIAYLSIAAGENLAALCREHGIGLEPDDWRLVHPDVPFRDYEVTVDEAVDVMAVREFLFARDSEGRGAEILRALYRTGAAFKSRLITFQVESEFGAESAWMEAFLERAAAAIAVALEAPESLLPGTIPVVLRKEPDTGGIAGGADKTSIELISDCWPEEPYRHWILAQELAKLIGFHLGGNLPADWWGHGNKPFGTYAAILALQAMGYDGEAVWVRDMHREMPDHEIFWALHDRFGAGWAARFFRLLREDGVDVERLACAAEDPRRECSRRVIVYLSRACGANVADLCASHGIGKEPPGWETSHPGEPFKTYRITAEDVDRGIESLTDR